MSLIKRKDRPKKNLGQHFLTDVDIVKKVIDLAGIGKNDIVLEIGSGTGIFTKDLCKIAKYVYSFELDTNLFLYCRKNLKFDNLCLINSDGFTYSHYIDFDIFFSSLPYYESRNAILWLCQKKFKKGLLVLQKEFANKLLANPGQKNYRSISILSQYKFDINVLLDIYPSSFIPPPAVNSVLVELLSKDLSLSKKNINDVQFLLSFRKKNVSFIFKYYNRNPLDYINLFDFNTYKDKKLCTLDVQNIIKLSMLLNDNDIA